MVPAMLDKIIFRIEQRLQALDLAPEGACKLAGLSRSTIRKMREQRAKGGQTSVRVSTLTALAPVLKVTPEWLAFGIDSTAAAGLVAAPITTRLQAGVWTEHRDAVTSGEVAYAPAGLVSRGAVVYAAEVVGQSMNRVYPEGTVAIIERRYDDLRTLEPNRRYHVERIRADGAVESTLKRVIRRADGSTWLVPESDDPEFQSAIPLREGAGEAINIAGRVVCAIVPG